VSKQRPPSKAQCAQRKYWEYLGQVCRAYGLLRYIEGQPARTTVLTQFELEQLRRALNSLNNIRHSVLRRTTFSSR